MIGRVREQPIGNDPLAGERMNGCIRKDGLQAPRKGHRALTEHHDRHPFRERVKIYR